MNTMLVTQSKVSILFYASNVDDSDADFYSVSYGLPTVIEGIDASITYGDSNEDLQVDYQIVMIFS